MRTVPHRIVQAIIIGMKHSKWLRVLIPITLIIIWLGVGSFGGPIFGKISEVSTNDQAAFLPASADSTQVQQLQRKYDKSQAIPAIALIEFSEPVNPATLGSYQAVSKRLAAVDGVQGPVVGPIPSKDFRAVEFIAPVSSKAELGSVIAGMRQELQKDLPSGSHAYVSGPAGLSADLIKAFGGIDSILLIVALIAVFVILLAVYRSLLLPGLVLLNAMFALCAAIAVVYLLAKHDIIELNGQSQGILSILVIGAATDYSLLLVSRYREALQKVPEKWDAIKLGVKGSFEPIIASAATVILALLCLLFSDLNSNRSLGPIAATGIVFSFLATMTFLPALLALFGRAAFWPSKVAMIPQQKSYTIKTGREELRGIWKYVGKLVANHARTVWIATFVVLAIGCLGLFQLKANGVPQTDIVLSESNAADGQKAIARHFSAGSSAPVLIAVPQPLLDKVLGVLDANQNITDIMAYSDRGLSSNLTNAKVVDGNILLSASLKADPYGSQAKSIISSLRDKLAQVDSKILVGGTTALATDTTNTAIHDLKKIVPLVLLMIFIVLALLLRALVAPLLLMLTVVLSFGATLGVSAIVFNHLFNFPGADATVPLFGFVFLVALGVDYNIFLISRTREEAIKYGTRAAIIHSLGKTGGVITSAGIVLAATFAALGIIPILFLAQIAFIVAFGVLLDTVIVRSLLVPALFDTLGSKVWWPSKLRK